MTRRKRMMEELDRDIREHIESETEDNIARGMPPEEARYAALRKFGNVMRVQEETRELWSVVWLEQWLADVRYGVRLFGKTPVVTAIALVSLALGIGANTAMFSLIDAVMLRALPVASPEQLVRVMYKSPKSPDPRPSLSNPVWEQIRDHQDVFSGVLAYAPETFDLAEGGEVNAIHGIYASGGYFATLGVRPVAGRLLMPSDDVRGCSGVAVLGYGFWQARYGGAESTIGSSMRLNGHLFPIVGVAQRGFTGTEVGTPLDVAIPVCAEAILDGKDAMLDVRDDWWLVVVGRLEPDLTMAQAAARMRVLSPGIFAAVVPRNWPAKSQDVFRQYMLVTTTASSGISSLRRQYSQPLEILMTVVGLVLLIACANVASLQLARSAARKKEIAVRLSLGASRGRLMRQVLTESLVLSACGALLGVLFARWGTAFLVQFVSTAQSPVFLDLRMNALVLEFTIGIAVLCGLLFGVWPAVCATRFSAGSALKEGGIQGSGGRSRSGAVRSIVAVQVALSLILLIGSGLFIHTFTNLLTLDPGYDPNNVLLVKTNIHHSEIPEPARVGLYSQMLARLEATAGVVAASQTWMMPLSGNEWLDDIKVPGRERAPGLDPNAYMNWVTPEFFRTMRTRLLSGRAFDARDSAASPPVAVVDEFVARSFFSGEDPLGKHLLVDTTGPLGSKPIEIIGVVENAKYDSLWEDPRPIVYFPLAQMSSVGEYTTFEIRSVANPLTMIPAVRDALGGVDKLASLSFVTLRQQTDDSVIQPQLLAVLSGFFGVLALLLTAIGLYGVMAYVVALRRREIGIRMALGAQRASVLGMVVRDGAVVVAAGMAAGLLGAVWATRLVQRLLFGVKPTDPWALSASVAALVGVALAANYVPARSAMRVDPLGALRHE